MTVVFLSFREIIMEPNATEIGLVLGRRNRKVAAAEAVLMNHAGQTGNQL